MKSGLFHEIHQKSRLSIKEVNEALQEYDLFSSQWTILFLLNRRGEMTQTEIWQYLNVEAPTITRTLARLENTGWVLRKEGQDKRERIVQLSDKAEKTIPEIERRIAVLEEKMLSALTVEEQRQLEQLLSKIKSTKEGELDG